MQNFWEVYSFDLQLQASLTHVRLGLILESSCPFFFFFSFLFPSFSQITELSHMVGKRTDCKFCQITLEESSYSRRNTRAQVSLPSLPPLLTFLPPHLTRKNGYRSKIRGRWTFLSRNRSERRALSQNYNCEIKKEWKRPSVTPLLYVLLSWMSVSKKPVFPRASIVIHRPVQTLKRFTKGLRN